MSKEFHTIRPYRPEDLDAAQRIWREVKWITEENYAPLQLLIEGGESYVGLQRGRAESLAITTAGEFQYIGTPIPLSAVMAVTTSLVARKQGLAGRTTAAAVRKAAEEGFVLAALGIFDQGYYDRLGFATMPYTRRLLFDPTQLTVPPPKRTPHRFDASHSDLLHRSRLRRLRGHGAVNLLSPTSSRAEMVEVKSSGGLGWYRADGEISHHLYGDLREEFGPFRVWWAAYENHEQLAELLGLLRSLGDQIHLVDMLEPRGIVLQDFLKQPFRFRRTTEKGRYEQTIITAAASQLRILDLPAAVAAMRLPRRENRKPLEINLILEDPIAKYLPDDGRWRGCAGSYVLTLGEESRAEPGQGRSLPTVEMTVGGFSQLWSGARSVDQLHLRDVMRTDVDTRRAIAERLQLPVPDFEWLF